MARAVLDPQQLPLFLPDSSWERPSSLPDLRGRPLVAEDWETRDGGLAAERAPAWVTGDGYPLGCAVATEGFAGYFPLRHQDTENFDEGLLVGWLNELHASGTPIVYHNAPYDVGWSGTIGVRPPAQLRDSLAQRVMIDENRLTYELDALGRDVLGRRKDETLLREAGVALGYKNPKHALHLMPARLCGPYAEEDARLALALHEAGQVQIDAEDLGAAYQLECDLIPVVHAMRARGVRVNLDRAQAAQAAARARVAQLLQEIKDITEWGRPMSTHEARSPTWLEWAFDRAAVQYRRGASGRGSFESDWMEEHEHPLPRLVARVRALDDVAEKFVGAFILDHAHRGRVHAEVHQFRTDRGGTRSHRLSYSDPALQQMPSRDPEAKAAARDPFEPEEGEMWAAPDYNQQEFRLIVHFANVMHLARADEAARLYADDPKTDFHNVVVGMTGLERKPAKDTNFAKAFGAGVDKFAEMIGKSREEAAAIMAQYDEEMPFVRQLGQACQKLADRRGWIRLLDGARCHFDQWEPAWREKDERYYPPRGLEAARVYEPWAGKRLRRAFTHKAMNRLIQGSAARQTKLAMRACYRAGLLPLLQMHDELDFSVPDQATGQRAATIMRDVVPLSVPMLVDCEYGPTWGQATHKKWAAAREAAARLAGAAGGGAGRARRPARRRAT